MEQYALFIDEKLNIINNLSQAIYKVIIILKTTKSKYNKVIPKFIWNKSPRTNAFLEDEGNHSIIYDSQL